MCLWPSFVAFVASLARDDLHLIAGSSFVGPSVILNAFFNVVVLATSTSSVCGFQVIASYKSTALSLSPTANVSLSSSEADNDKFVSFVMTLTADIPRERRGKKRPL